MGQRAWRIGIAFDGVLEVGDRSLRIVFFVQRVGQADASVFILAVELDGFLAMFGVRGQVTDPEVLFALGTGKESHKLRLVVAADDADGFLKTLIGDGFEVEVGANLHWSSKQGVSFDGSAALMAKAASL